MLFCAHYMYITYGKRCMTVWQNDEHKSTKRWNINEFSFKWGHRARNSYLQVKPLLWNWCWMLNALTHTHSYLHGLLSFTTGANQWWSNAQFLTASYHLPTQAANRRIRFSGIESKNHLYLTLFTLANIAWKEMYSSVRFFFFVVLVRTSPTPVNNTAHEHITYSHSRIDTLRITTLTNVQRAPCLECFIDIHICVFVHSWVKCRKFVSHSEFSLLYTNFSTSGNCEVEKKIKQPQQQQFTAERIKWAPTAAGSRWRSTTSAPFAVFVLG